MSSDNTYYTQGSSKDFLKDKGFDDKWTVKPEKKVDAWTEVTGMKQKKSQLSGAQKRTKAAKISEAAMKAAASVRVDFDGEALERLVAKQQKKDDAGPRQQQQRKIGASMMGVGNEVKIKKAGAGGGKRGGDVVEEPGFDRSVDLSGKQLRESMEANMAQHQGRVDLQLLKLAEVWEEAFSEKRFEYAWDAATALGTPPSSWTTLPLSLVKSDAQSALVEWLCSKEVSAKDLSDFVGFLVENALPGGGAKGNGGKERYVGLIALLQLILQKCSSGAAPGASWHAHGRRLGDVVALAQGRVAYGSAPALSWMLVQLAEGDAGAALSAALALLLPVLESERALGGKVALQCSEVIHHAVGAIAGRKSNAPLSFETLLDVSRLLDPPAGTDASSNAEAVARLRECWDAVVDHSAVALAPGKCAGKAMPALLALIAADGNPPAYQTRALQLARRLLGSSAGVSALVGSHASHMDAVTRLLEAVGADASGVDISALEAGLGKMVGECKTMIAAASREGKEGLAAGAVAARADKVRKKALKAAAIEEYMARCAGLRAKFAGRRRFRALSSLTVLALLSVCALAAFAHAQPACRTAVAPLAARVEKAAAKGMDGLKALSFTEKEVVRVYETCYAAVADKLRALAK